MEPTTKKWKTEKLKSKKRICSEVSVNSPGNPWSPDRQPRQHPTTQFFTGRMPFLLPIQQHQDTEGLALAVAVEASFYGLVAFTAH